MSKEAAAKAKEIRAKHPELFPQQEKSLAWKVTDSSLYDWNSTARFLLTQLAVLAMDEDSNYPEDAPPEFQADKEGWCWMAQDKLMLKIGKSESTVHRLIKRFRKDGVILYRDWYDSNMTHHAEYKVVESVVDAFQRPSQKADVERPPASKRDYKTYDNKGAFKKGADKRRANMDEDHE